jgi:hypothetical protein
MTGSARLGRTEDLRPDRFLSRTWAVCITEAFSALGIWVLSGPRELAAEQLVRAEREPTMSSEQFGAVGRCWAGDEATRWVADWMRPKLEPVASHDRGVR